MRHVYIFSLLLCMLISSCRSSHQASKESVSSAEQSASRDSGSTKRTSTDEGERFSEFFNHECEDLEFTQVHERDSSGNEKTTTSIRAKRQNEAGNRTLQKEKSIAQADSSACHSNEASRNEDYSSDKVIDKQPPPIVAVPQSGIPFRLIVIIIICLVVLIWPEKPRKVCRWIYRQLMRIIGWKQ